MWSILKMSAIDARVSCCKVDSIEFGFAQIVRFRANFVIFYGYAKPARNHVQKFVTNMKKMFKYAVRGVMRMGRIVIDALVNAQYVF